MSPFWRGTLFGAANVGALAIAFACGYSAKSKSKTAQPTVAVQPQTAATPALGPAPVGMPIVVAPPMEPPPTPDSPFVTVSRSRATDVPPIPILDLDNVPRPSVEDPIDPSDPALQMIRKAAGHKTGSIQEDLPPLGPAPGMDPHPVEASPKLDIPPRVVTPGLPPQPMLTHIVNKRDIALDFAVTKVGSSKFASVELWTTRDGGQTWACTDKKANWQSPFKTRLGSEGDYGFRLVLESESGMRTPEPKAGAAADLQLRLDLTAPAVSLLGVEPAGPAGKVWINWTMADDNLDPKGTRIEYSICGCEWKAIEIPTLMHTGDKYFQDWTVPADLPAEVLIRITARDLAGNVTTVQSPGKVLVDLVAPEGKITDLHEDGAEPELGPMPRMVGETRIQFPVHALPPPLFLDRPFSNSPASRVSATQLISPLGSPDDPMQHFGTFRISRELFQFWVSFMD
jgi:hypothetical protein